jgi:hypothetical protein
MNFSLIRSYVCIILILVLSFPQFLSAQKSSNSVFKRKRNKVDISDLELRLRLSDHFVRYTEFVEEAADRIYYSASDPEVRRAALMWKIYGISAMNKAINMPDPIASFYNAWPLAKQTVIFFESGPGREKLGDYHKVALDLSLRLESKLDSIIIDIGGMDTFLEAEPEVDIWVQNHPIEDFYFTRESTMEFFAKWLGEERFGIGSSVSTLTEQMIELSNRINLYADMIPRQARWQADFALMNYLEDTAFILGRIDSLIYALERVTRIIEMSPELVESNRDIILQDIDRQRRESLHLLVEERKAVVDELTSERIEVISAITQERLAVLEEIKGERALVLEEIRNISSDIVSQSGQEAERIVDIIFWRLVVLIGIIGVIAFIAIYLFKKV